MKGRLNGENIVFVGEEDDVNAAVLLFQSIDLYCTVHARTSYADMVNSEAQRLFEENEQFIELWNIDHDTHRAGITLSEYKRDVRNEYSRNKWYYGYRVGFNTRLRERFEELRKANLSTSTGRELATCKSS